MNTSKILFAGVTGVILTLSAISCNRESQWRVNGSIDGAEGKEMLLQASTNGRWYTFDTVKIDSKGRFSAAQAPSGYPDIYRLNLDGKNLYFPVDSIETITVTTTLDGFDRDYTLAGTSAADMMMQANAVINDAVARLGADAALTDEGMKRSLTNLILTDPAGIVSYYIINRQIQGKPLFNPADRMDVRIIGAVANAYNDRRPADPRTRYLKSLFLANRGIAVTDTIHAGEIPFFDISLYDNNGALRTLSDVVGHGKVVILNFTAYGVENSPAFNRHLNDIYQRYHSAGLEIYQVAVDADEYVWKQSARNLPWITVYNSLADGQSHLMNYNVTDLPTTYIFNRQGELAERVDDQSRLDARVKAYM